MAPTGRGAGDEPPAGDDAARLDDTLMASAERMAARALAEAVRDPPPVAVGELVRGRYRVEQVMAEGGNGVVLRASDLELDRKVAIKMLTVSAGRDPNLRARFKLEARHAVRIKSEHVARVYDVGELDDGTQYIVLELLEGEDLATRLAADGRLDVTDAIDLVLQACEALAEAHHLGIVHRDIKLANLFVTRRADASPILKVIDFGLAKHWISTGSDATGLTQGMAVGTPRNMAPEQVTAADGQDHRLDVWALGTVLYELLAGEAPFDGPTLQAVFAKVLVGEPRPLASLRPELPPELVAIVGECLIKDPQARMGSVVELAAALLPFASAEGRTIGERAIRVGAPARPGAATDGPPTPRPQTPSPGTLPPRPAAQLGTSQRMPSTTLSGRAAPHDRRRAWAWPLAGLSLAAVVVLAAMLASGGADDDDRPRPAPPVATRTLGTACQADRECGPLTCVRGLCTSRCQTDADCGLPATCLQGTCTLPLRVGFLHYGVPEDDGWTRAHEDARREVARTLPYLVTDLVTDTAALDAAERGIDQLVARGAQVVVATSSSHLPAVRAKLGQYPAVTFLVVATGPAEAGIGMIDSRLEDAFYLAGMAAARTSRTHRLCFIGPHLHAQPIRFANAFLLGARRIDPAAVLEIRWMGSWFDASPADDHGLHLEERLTQQLVASGCDVIAHNLDSSRVVLEVERLARAGRRVFSLANNTVEQCDAAPTSCLGTTTRQWSPMYARLFDTMHQGRFKTGGLLVDGIRVDRAESPVAFVLNRQVLSVETAGEIGRALAELARPGAQLFTGPFCWSGEPRECLATGVPLVDDRRWAMCRFVDGVVERDEPANPRSRDRPAEIPASCGR